MTKTKCSEFEIFGLKFSMALPDDDFLQADSVWRSENIYEPFLANQVLPKSGVAVDIGGGFGLFSIPFALAHPSWTVWCFEPNRYFFDKILDNVRLNKVENVIAINAAIGDFHLDTPPENMPYMDYYDGYSKHVKFNTSEEKPSYIELASGATPEEFKAIEFLSWPASALKFLKPDLMKLTAPRCEKAVLQAVSDVENLEYVVGESWNYISGAEVLSGYAKNIYLPKAGSRHVLQSNHTCGDLKRRLDIVVAMYNAEKFILDCIDSIVEKSQSNIRVLVVDDGSTDSSADLVAKRYDERDDVVLLRKINGGCASARNYGRLHSDATYIAFIDADDWVDSDFFPSLLELAIHTGSEIVQGEYIESCDEGAAKNPTDATLDMSKWPVTLSEYVVHNESAYDLVNSQPTIWRRVYRRDFLDDKNIWFPEHIRAFDDQIFQIVSLQYVNIVPCLSGPKYYYRQHPMQDIRAGDERCIFSLEMFRMIIKRGLQEGWNDFSAILVAYLHTVNWIDTGIRGDLKDDFSRSAAQLWVFMEKSLNNIPLEKNEIDLVANPSFHLNVEHFRRQFAGIPPSISWSYLDSITFHSSSWRC